jgi:CheY-like chemotaxis protein
VFRVLIADDSFDDREILKLEVEKALKAEESDIRFYEAASVKQALERLKVQSFDLMTLDIEFDRMNEGLEVLPEIFESYPTLNVIVISGKLNKSEVSGSLFRFTKDNVLKGKRWARHFDVLDKKDSKEEALRDAYHFALKRHDTADKVRDLFLMAESYLEKGEVEHCLGVYQKIQELAPEDEESNENISIVKGAAYERALEYLRKGETVISGLLLGYHIENRLKRFTKRILGRDWPGLFECGKELERSRKFSAYKKDLFQKLIRVRNKSIHHPNTISEGVFEEVQKDLKMLEGNF